MVTFTQNHGTMKIAVIGGSGFVGTRLIDILRKENDVINIDKQHSHFHDDITKIADVRYKEQIVPLLSGIEVVVLLAAEHRDDVTPTSLYYDVNVGGMKNVLRAMEEHQINRIVFTSSVAVYGLNKDNPDENHPVDPFNHYGKSKYQAEEVLQKWNDVQPDRNINIIRPTVIFGERNRGNVYNLLKQISSGKFLMVGKGKNEKSMAYVENVVAFIKYCIENQTHGYNIFNYIDKPDYNMNQLVSLVSKVIGKRIPSIHIPYWLGMMGGYCFDILAFLTGRKLSISSVRVKKFCATTKFDSNKAYNLGFIRPFSIEDGLKQTLQFEFIEKRHEVDGIIFKSE